MQTLFPFFNHIYMNRHPTLVVYSSDFITICNNKLITTFMACKTMLCIVFTIIHLMESIQCLWRQFCSLRNWKKTFEIFKIYHGPSMIQQMDETNKDFSFLFYYHFATWITILSHPLDPYNFSFYTWKLIGHAK
jgi:hypothetical protein